MSTFNFDNKFKNLLTSARFMVMKLHKIYVHIMTSLDFVNFKFISNCPSLVMVEIHRMLAP